ncbi:MAG: hypothetical protein AAF721_08670 [Myxococcota bacterium]
MVDGGIGSGGTGGAAADYEADTGAEMAGRETTGSATTGSETTEGAACETDGTCTVALPPGWSGPALLYAGPEPPPDCPAAAHDLVLEGGVALDARAPACQCTCGNATDVECSVDVTERGTNCGDLVFNPDTFTVADGECVAIATDDGAFSSGTPFVGLQQAECEPSEEFSFPEPSWAARVALCEPEIQPICDGGTCLPEVGEDYGQACIYAGGESECPDGPYQHRLITYASFSDSRPCSSCSCGEPSGACTGDVHYQPGCGLLAARLASASAPTCTELGESPGAIRFSADVYVTCEPAGGVASGSVTPLGPVTVCCA